MPDNFNNDYAAGIVDLEQNKWALEDKRRNAIYQDNLDNIVQDALCSVAEEGGILITDLKQMDDVKELLEDMQKRIKKVFPEANWPYVDENL